MAAAVGAVRSHNRSIAIAIGIISFRIQSVQHSCCMDSLLAEQAPREADGSFRCTLYVNALRRRDDHVNGHIVSVKNVFGQFVEQLHIVYNAYDFSPVRNCASFEQNAEQEIGMSVAGTNDATIARRTNGTDDNQIELHDGIECCARYNSPLNCIRIELE